MIKTIRIVCLLLATLSASSCAKSSTMFELYFFPSNTGLLNNDWNVVANVNVTTREEGIFAGKKSSRIQVSFRENGEEARVLYYGGWSENQIIETQGRWISVNMFQLEITSRINEDISSKEILNIGVPSN